MENLQLIHMMIRKDPEYKKIIKDRKIILSTNELVGFSCDNNIRFIRKLDDKYIIGTDKW